MLELYNYYRSSASFRVRIALNLKGLHFTEIPVNLIKNGGEQFSAQYQAMNSQGLVPTLKDNDKIITQSLAIIEYLDEIYPAPSLLPEDPYMRALARSLALMIGADIHPLNNLRVLRYLTENLGLTEEMKMQWYQHWIAMGLSALEKKLAWLDIHENYCLGNSPSIADIFLVPQMYNARRFSCDLNDYPTLLRIDAHCQEHPAFAKAWPHEV